MHVKKAIKYLTNRIIKGLILSGLLLSFVGCDKNNSIIEPKNQILGKWVLIQTNDIRVESTEYQEFLPDSVVRFFRLNESGHFSENIYWINDSLLFQGEISKSHFVGNAYKYEFFDKNNKLRLIPDYDHTTNINVAPIPITVYQRFK